MSERGYGTFVGLVEYGMFGRTGYVVREPLHTVWADLGVQGEWIKLSVFDRPSKDERKQEPPYQVYNQTHDLVIRADQVAMLEEVELEFVPFEEEE